MKAKKDEYLLSATTVAFNVIYFNKHVSLLKSATVRI